MGTPAQERVTRQAALRPTDSTSLQRNLEGEGMGLRPAGLGTCTSRLTGDDVRRAADPGAPRWLVASPSGDTGGTPPPKDSLQQWQKTAWFVAERARLGRAC